VVDRDAGETGEVPAESPPAAWVLRTYPVFPGDDQEVAAVTCGAGADDAGHAYWRRGKEPEGGFFGVELAVVGLNLDHDVLAVGKSGEASFVLGAAGGPFPEDHGPAIGQSEAHLAVLG